MEFSILLLNKGIVVSFSPEYGSDSTSPYPWNLDLAG